MSVRNGKYFYSIEHPKPNLADIPPSCKTLLKKNEEIYDFDFKKFQQSTYQSSAFRFKSMLNGNQNTNNYYSGSSRNNDIYSRKKQSFSSNLNGGLNFDYNNLQIDSNYSSKNDQSRKSGYDKSSKEENFFTNKISMVPPPGENIYIDKSNKHSNYDASGSSSKRNNYNDVNSTNSKYNHENTTYKSDYNRHNLDSQSKHSNYEYMDKTSSKQNYQNYESNVSQASKPNYQSKSSKQYTSNAHTNLDNPSSQVNPSSRTTKSNISSNANRSSTTNSTFTTKINSSSKPSSSRQTSLYPNDIDTSSKYSKKTPVYDYSKPNPAGIYNPDTSSHTKSYKSSNMPPSTTSNVSDRNNYNIQNHPSSSRHNAPSSVTSSTSANISSRNNYNIQDHSSSIRHNAPSSVTSSTTANIGSRNNYNIQDHSSSIRHNAPSSVTSSTSANIGNRSNFNMKNQPPSIQSTSTTASTRQQYTSTSSNYTTNSVRGSKSSVSNQNARFTTTSDLLNQTPQNYGNGSSQFQSTIQKQTRTSMQQPLYDDIRTPNLTQYNRPQVGSSNVYSSNSVTNATTTTITSSTTNSQAQFIAHQAQYAGNKDIPSNPPTQTFLKKNAISNPGYDFLQSNLQNQSQSQSMMNDGAAANDSFTIDPVPKKTRVEFPEPQTAPKPFQIIDASLEGEVSQEEVQKVEDINELMKSFHADSDSENNFDNVDADNKAAPNKNNTKKPKPISSFNIDELKKDLFSSLLEEEEDEAQLDMDTLEDNEKNNQPLEDLSVFDDIEQKSKDFDDQNILNEEDQDSNKLEIASGEDSPNDSTLPKDLKEQNNTKSNSVVNNYTNEEEELMEIQSFFDKIKKSIGNEEEEEENTADFIKQLEEENYNSQKQTKQKNESEDQTNDMLIEDDHIEEDFIDLNGGKLNDNIFFEEEDFISKEQAKEPKTNNQINKNKEEIQNEDKTVEDVFLEEEENESMIEKVDDQICLSDDDDENKLSIEKDSKLNNKNLDNDFKLDIDNEEEDSETDASIEAIIKKANEQHLISSGNYEEEEDTFLIEDNKTPISRFKKPLNLLSQHISNKYSNNSSELKLPFDLADKILKKQLKRILSL